uniref:ubiquitinyl hydrolase 1 n=1 Tax=Spongospora subterranea TaxID=70186 RepID=A0A0H5R5Y9_9EUKA|eukprot:CRZ09565.1 hypothetical protein [Spongospora subterranea]
MADLVSLLVDAVGADAVAASQDEVTVVRLLSMMSDYPPGIDQRIFASTLLFLTNDDIEFSLAIIEHIKEADNYQVYPIIASRSPLGLEHHHNSCYISAMICAMFTGVSNFDAMFLPRSCSTKVDQLRKLLILIVRLLRSGSKIHKNLVHVFRYAVFQAGFMDCSQIFQQQDVHELFVFILDLLNAPVIAMLENFHHGGIEDANIDTRMLQERCLQLSISETSSCVKRLLDCFFFETTITGLQRSFPSNCQLPVTALCTLSMLPFQSDCSNPPLPSNKLLAETPMVVPLILKRFGVDGQKVRFYIHIPLCIDATSYLIPGSQPRESNFESCTHLLLLKSVICHLGAGTSNSGHYIAFSCEKTNNPHGWMLFDDLAETPAKFGSFAALSAEYEETLTRDSYMALYELVDLEQLAQKRKNSLICDAQQYHDFQLAYRLQNKLA